MAICYSPLAASLYQVWRRAVDSLHCKTPASCTCLLSLILQKDKFQGVKWGLGDTDFHDPQIWDKPKILLYVPPLSPYSWILALDLFGKTNGYRWLSALESVINAMGMNKGRDKQQVALSLGLQPQPGPGSHLPA